MYCNDFLHCFRKLAKITVAKSNVGEISFAALDSPKTLL